MPLILFLALCFTRISRPNDVFRIETCRWSRFTVDMNSSGVSADVDDISSAVYRSIAVAGELEIVGQKRPR